MARQICEEDEIIERLREGSEMYYDAEFGPSSLYWDEHKVPLYDECLREPIVWIRPHELADRPDYFAAATLDTKVVEGRVGDAWLLGAAAAIAGHPEYLVENLFGSDADDFKAWGVYTCRFYKDGRWEEVVTDTRIPCTSERGERVPVGGRSSDAAEQWVALLVKAYAKLQGSYEALSLGSLGDALVDLTGGSSEDVALVDEEVAWQTMKTHLARHDVMCCTLDAAEDAVHSMDLKETAAGLLPAHAYCVTRCLEIGGHKFVLLRNPWRSHDGTTRGEWHGPWSNASTHWDDAPEVLGEIQDDSSIPWERGDAGYFFMALEDVCAHFDTLHVCHLFPDDAFRQYQARGAWAGKTAGGPLGDDQVRAAVKQQPNVAEVEAPAPTPQSPAPAVWCHPLAEALATQHARRVRRDDNPYWFNNPQFRVTATAGQAVDVHMSLMQTGSRSATGRRVVGKLGFEVVRARKALGDRARVFALDDVDFVATTPLDARASREVSAACVQIGRAHV